MASDEDVKINLRLPEFKKKLIAEVSKKMMLACAMVDGYIKQSISTSNFGGTFPSAPGEAPHVGTGALRNSITHVVDTHPTEIVGTIGVAKGTGANQYARRLELGFIGVDTLGRNYAVAPRPFLRPALAKNKASIRKILLG